jgi:PAS domain S-box-containing protein
MPSGGAGLARSPGRRLRSVNLRAHEKVAATDMIQPPDGPAQPGEPGPEGPAFLRGGGDMGALMRAHDWAATAFGPAVHWPQALRTVVRLVLDSGHPMCIGWGPSLLCLYNDAFRPAIRGERHPAALGRPAAEVWHECWHLMADEVLQMLAGTGAARQLDLPVPVPVTSQDGLRPDVRWTCSCSPIDDAQASGGIGGVLVICTESPHQVLAALQESEARFRTALRAGRMGSWETDWVTMTRTWSQEGMDLFGISLVDGRGQVGGDGDEYVAALHPDDRHLAPSFREQGDRQDSFTAEYRIVRPDGRTVWLYGRGLVIERAPDGSARRLVSIMADATERKLAEERLRVERERLALALSAGQMGAYDLDIRQNLLWWSPQTFAVFGVSADHFIPTTDAVTALIHPDDRARSLQLRTDAIVAGEPFIHEFRVLRADGSTAWVGLRGEAEYSATGEALRSFGVVMDITERKRAEQALRDADQRKDNFIATLAHELRNPLAPIRNAINVLRRIGPDDARVGWCHDVIDRQTAQMARLLDDLLDVSRVTRGQLTLRSQPLKLAEVIEQAIEIAQPLIDASGHVFTVTLPPQPLHLSGDLTRLAQVFSNVLINAAKYTPPPGRIALTAQAEGDQVVVEVADSGIGIAPQHLSQIFELFGQVESALNRSQGGQGIGLSLAKGLVELHGGSIGARSDGIGKGSEFVVRLPLRRDAAGDGVGMSEGAAADIVVADDVPPMAPDATEPVVATLRILVADDLRDIADSLAIVLESMGHVVHVAYDGLQALQMAEALKPQVVLLDLGMPKMNGYDVCRRIRAAPWGLGMTVVAQTGWGHEDDRRRTADAGFDHHLTKPVLPADLAALLQRMA